LWKQNDKLVEAGREWEEFEEEKGPAEGMGSKQGIQRVSFPGQTRRIGINIIKGRTLFLEKDTFSRTYGLLEGKPGEETRSKGGSQIRKKGK